MNLVRSDNSLKSIISPAAPFYVASKAPNDLGYLLPGFQVKSFSLERDVLI